MIANFSFWDSLHENLEHHHDPRKHLLGPNVRSTWPFTHYVQAWPRAPPDLVLAMLNAYPDAAKIPGILLVASNQNAEGDPDLRRCKYYICKISAKIC